MLRRALVTGANGFLGRRVVARLETEGWTVTRAVRAAPTPVPPGTIVLGPGPWTTDALAAALASTAPDVVFHLAGSAWATSVAALYETNLLLAARLLDVAVARTPSPAVVLIGSAAEYGFVPEDRQPVTEDQPCVPLTHHGVAKCAQTQLGMAWARAGLKVLVARLFNPVGSGMPPRLALASFAAQIRAAGPKLEVGDLDVARDFIDVNDAALLVVALAANPANFGQVINICSGAPVRLRPLVEEMIRLAGRPMAITVVPARQRLGEMRVLRGDTTRLRAAGLTVRPPNFSVLLPDLLRG
ncbi:MAG: NAD-dependent epimerase/dehydratase family protein [Rhodospirillales bacterium]|nr:NAD-dependent epimerase/dehydratase family protein [Rhodospirillales bacterium]